MRQPSIESSQEGHGITKYSQLASKKYQQISCTKLQGPQAIACPKLQVIVHTLCAAIQLTINIPANSNYFPELELLVWLLLKSYNHFVNPTTIHSTSFSIILYVLIFIDATFLAGHATIQCYIMSADWMVYYRF